MKLFTTILTAFLPALACAMPSSAPPRSNASAPAVTSAIEDVDALLQQGRDRLDAGDGAGAEARFTQAASIDPSLKTRVWVLRSWLAQGRINDTYDALDKELKGSNEPEADYLWGMAFALDAKRAIETNQTGPFTTEKLNDASSFLDRTVTANAARFRDATLMQCWVAWETQSLQKGRVAADKAVQVWPSNPESYFQVGRFALAQFQGAQGDDKAKTSAAKDLDVATMALEQAARMLDGTTDAAKKTMLAKVSINLGHAHKFKEEIDAAVASYAKGLGLDPTIANFPQLLGALGQEKFLAALDGGEKAFVANWGAENPADAGLLWWLGWVRLQQKQYKEAELAFAQAVKKYPPFVNSWFYIAVCRFSHQDFDGAIDALKKNDELAADDLGPTILQNPNFNLAMLDSLVAHCASQNPPRNIDAAILSSAQARAKPEEVRYWNNAGLFYRDAGDVLARTKDEEKRKQAVDLWERAYAAYSTALDLSPDDPAILNDTALMLHYNLDRDLDRAKELYKRAITRAEETLKRTDLKPGERKATQTARDDATNNLRKLEAGIKTQG